MAFIVDGEKSGGFVLDDEPKKSGVASRLLSMPQEALGEAQTIEPETAKAALEAALSLGSGAVSWIPAGWSMVSPLTLDANRGRG